MKVLVTGGAGFLGSHLVEALVASGDDVTVLDHRLRGKCLAEPTLRRICAIEDDVLDADVVRRAARGCAAIFHCAAIVGVEAYSREPAKVMEVEEEGLRNVCRAALANGDCRVIYMSSSAVYGQAGGETPLDEALIVAPVSNYGIAKRFNELYLAAQHAQFGLRSAALRVFNVFGPRQDERLVIPRFIWNALAGQPIVIYGDGAQTRDFVYVDDVVVAALWAADRVAGCEIVNVCSGTETSITALADSIVAVTASPSPIVRRARPAERQIFEVERCVGSRARLERLLGAAPPTPLEDGLRRTIEALALAPLDAGQ